MLPIGKNFLAVALQPTTLGAYFPGSFVSPQCFEQVPGHHGVSLPRCDVQGHEESTFPPYGLHPRSGVSWDRSDPLGIRRPRSSPTFH